MKLYLKGFEELEALQQVQMVAAIRLAVGPEAALSAFLKANT